MDRIRITHPHDLYKGKIGYVIERIDQHSLCTYVVVFKGVEDKRAYQRNDFKFLKPIKTKRKMRTYTKPEILRAVKDHMKTWDTGRKHINDALMLTEMESQIIGIIDMALPEPVKEFNPLGARVGKIYPSVKA